MGIFDFLKKHLSSFNNSIQHNTEPEYAHTSDLSGHKETASFSVQFSVSASPAEQVQKQTNIDVGTEYVCLSTSGDENVCPMCAQFEGKFFLKSDAPKLPLCPVCSCMYEYYIGSDLPTDAIISHREDFVYPAECAPLFFKHQNTVYEESDINKQIRLCERDIKKLPEFMAPYLSAGFPAPPELVCRDLLPILYMRLGKWQKAEKTIKSCIDAKAYYPSDGSDELDYLAAYRKVATKALSYISSNPGCLQRNIYKQLAFEGKEKECLKDFLRYSTQITKEKSSNTNKLFIKTE